MVAYSRLSHSGEDAKVKGTRKVGGAKKRKKKGERACDHYEPLPPTFGTFEIIRSWNLSQISREIISRWANPLCEREQIGV